MKRAKTRQCIERFLDDCSVVAKESPQECKLCGSAMTPVKLQFSLYGTDMAWAVALPLCLNCEPSMAQKLAPAPAA